MFTAATPVSMVPNVSKQVTTVNSGVLSQDDTLNFTIAYTHDLHSHLYTQWDYDGCSGGMPLISTKVNEIRANGPLLLFDCGDTLSGGPVNDLNDGIPMIETMNAIGYDAMTLDNHEFDHGVSNLKAMIDTADFELLSANAMLNDAILTAPYSIEEVSGYQIGVIGLTPPFWYAPDGVTFSNMTIAAASAVSDLEDSGVNFIILLGCMYPDFVAVQGIDLIVEMKGVSVGYQGATLVAPSVGIYSTQLGVLHLEINMNTGTVQDYSFESVDIGDGIQPDVAIENLIETWNAPLTPSLDLPVGYFDVYHARSDMSQMMAETVRASSGADVGVYYVGGVRESCDEGFVTLREIYQIEPFSNTVTTIDLPGSIVQNIITSNQYSTSISSFDPNTMYTVASSNFSVTYYERTYPDNATNRHDYPHLTIVDAMSEYINQTSPVDRDTLQVALTHISERIDTLSAEAFRDGNISIQTEIISKLTDAATMIHLGQDSTAIAYVNDALNHVKNDLVLSCPRRWLSIEIGCVIYYFSSMTPTTTLVPTYTTTTPTAGPANPFGIIVVATISIILILLIFLKRRYLGQYKRVPAKMQKAMFWGSAGLGMVLGGVSLILTTLQEYSRVKYFDWYS